MLHGTRYCTRECALKGLLETWKVETFQVAPCQNPKLRNIFLRRMSNVLVIVQYFESDSDIFIRANTSRVDKALFQCFIHCKILDILIDRAS